MESSSEDSFAWTDTSSDSFGNYSMAIENTVNNSIQSIKHAKKKRSKEVSCSSVNSTEDILEGNVDVKVEKESNSETKHTSLKKKMVKSEPESDSDVPKKKKKKKHLEVNGHSYDQSQESASYDESFLDEKVKLESKSVLSTPHQTKKQRKESIGDAYASSEEKVKYGDSSTQEENTSSNNIEEGIGKSKKKKKKRKRHESEEEKVITDDKMEVEDSPTTELNHTPETSFADNNITQDDSEYDEISAIHADDTISSPNSQNITKESKKKKESLYKSTIVNQLKSGNHVLEEDSGLISQADKRRARISDRIRFEDDEDLETDSSHINETPYDKPSSKLKKFIKANNNMKMLSHELPSSSVLTHDDEIWIFKCPKAIDIQALCGIGVNLNGKCKIKVDGQTYEGSLDEVQNGTATALSMDHSTYKIENLPLNGIIHFRKRIPKAHFRDDNIMINDQTNFIPLPETKCRHPLFGSNYKRAIKIPAAVAERLNPQTQEVDTNIEKRTKKRHKKDKMPEYEQTDATSEVPTVKSEEKKKKKRKHTEDDGPAPKKVKRIKHDPESEQAWDSAQAIEENLFNF